MLFEIIRNRFDILGPIEKKSFILYFKNWLNKFILKDDKKKLKEVKAKIMDILKLVSKVDFSEKKFFEDNIIQNMLRLLQYNNETDPDDVSNRFLI